jgi:CHAT domain-containing protein
LDDLGLLLFKPLLPLLREKGIEGLYLVPHEFLYWFPLHAVRWYEKGNAKYLCDEFAVAYLPSANMLPKLPRPDPLGDAFVLANPEAGTRHTLPFSHWEGMQLRKSLGVPEERCFLGATGTLAATDRWTDCGVVHFSCHGHGDERFAPLSHLRLADDLLLAHDVLHRKPELKSGAVVVLNGCQTSVPDWRAVNEGMGLMTAFLLRGAGVVFSTQWSVLDMCAAPMVITFAQQVRQGASPATALKTAQKQLRETKVRDMLDRMREVQNCFAEKTPEWGQVVAQRA